jgi:hypothetical protein
VKKINEESYRLPRMRFTAEKTACCMAVAAHMPIKEDEDDDKDSDSETEDASTGVASASSPTAAAAAAPTTTDSASAAVTPGGVPGSPPAAPGLVPGSPPAAVTPVRKMSVQIDLEEKDKPITVNMPNGSVMTWIQRVPNCSSFESSKKQFRRYKKMHEYWYKPVDELLAHEVNDMLSELSVEQIIQMIISADAVVGADCY